MNSFENYPPLPAANYTLDCHAQTLRYFSENHLREVQREMARECWEAIRNQRNSPARSAGLQYALFILEERFGPFDE